MPALTYKAALLHFSYFNGTLTVYPQFDDITTLKNRGETTPSLFSLLFSAAKPWDTAYALLWSYAQIKQLLPNIRFIYQLDDDHALYHRDLHFKRLQEHSHFNFEPYLTKTELSDILEIFVNNALLHDVEKTEFLNFFGDRYNRISIEIDKICEKNPIAENAQSAIIRFISNIEDNDILTHIHQYLLHDKFAELRKSEVGNDRWQGTNAEHVSVKTSKAWAMIERGLVLQIAHNIKEGCKLYTPVVAKHHANRLSKRNQFFGVSHDCKEERSKSPSIEAFENADKKTLDERYNIHFGAFNP